MRIYFATILLVLLSFSSRSQGVIDIEGQNDTLRLTSQEAETRFLELNLLLLAERLNIKQAEALVLQAKRWPNPSVSIEEVNLWASPAQKAHFEESLPPLVGDWGQYQQISIQLEQLVQTAGKRRKLVAMEQVNTAMAAQYFEEMLGNLKVEFRHALAEYNFLQQSTGIFEQQLGRLQNLLVSYKKQVDQGNFPRGEYMRLKALELELKQQLNEQYREFNAARRELGILMKLNSDAVLVIEAPNALPATDKIRQLNLGTLHQAAFANRPDVKLSELETDYYDKMYRFERAQRVPDLNLSGGYDRGGNFMLDFIGFGLAFDLPIFDRNQGNIKYAQIGIEQSKLMAEGKEIQVRAEVTEAFRNLLIALNFYEEIDEDHETQLDQMLERYSQNFTQRNISLLEYLDFFETYLENKQIMLESRRDLNQHYQTLLYTIGTELD